MLSTQGAWSGWLSKNRSVNAGELVLDAERYPKTEAFRLRIAVTYYKYSRLTCEGRPSLVEECGLLTMGSCL